MDQQSQNSSGPPGAPSQQGQTLQQLSWLRRWWDRRGQFDVGVVILYGIATAIFFLLRALPIPIAETDYMVPLEWGWLTYVVFYTWKSFRTVDTTERAVKTFFKRDIQDVDRGLTFVPLWICDLITFTRNMIVLEVGTPQELTIRGEGGQVVGTERVEAGAEVIRASQEPLRVTFSHREGAVWNRNWWNEKGDQLDEKKFPDTDHLSRRLTADPNVVIWLRITRPRQFVRTMGTVERAIVLLEKAAMIAIQEYCSKRTPSVVLSNLEDAQDYLRDRLERLVGDPDAEKRARERGETEDDIRKWRIPEPWGLDIAGAKIKAMGLPFRVNKAIADAREAGFQRDKIVTLADAEAERMRRLNELANQPGGGLMLQLEQLATIKATIGPTDKVVLVDSTNPIAAVLGGIVGGKHILQQPPPSAPTLPAPPPLPASSSTPPPQPPPPPDSP